MRYALASVGQWSSFTSCEIYYTSCLYTRILYDLVLFIELCVSMSYTGLSAEQGGFMSIIIPYNVLLRNTLWG